LIINSEGYLALVKRKSNTDDFDYVIGYQYNMYNLAKEFTTAEAVKRVTVLSTTDSDDKAAQSSLASGTITSTGDTTVTLSSNGIKLEPDYTINTTNTTLTIKEVNNGSVVFTVGGTNPSPNVSYTIYGNTFSGAYSGVYGEAFNQSNWDNNNGNDIELVCKYLQSSAEAKSLAEKVIERYPADIDDFDFTISFSAWAQPQLELGDLLIILEPVTSSYKLYSINSIDTRYGAENANFVMTVQARAIGSELTDIIWDRNGAFEGDDDLYYDSGIVWDMDIYKQNSDTNTYSSPVGFS